MVSNPRLTPSRSSHKSEPCYTTSTLDPSGWGDRRLNTGHSDENYPAWGYHGLLHNHFGLSPALSLYTHALINPTQDPKKFET